MRRKGDTSEGIHRKRVTVSLHIVYTERERETLMEKDRNEASGVSCWKLLTAIMQCTEALHLGCRTQFPVAGLPGVGAHKLGTESAPSLV